MKPTINLMALICITGFAGSWECGVYSFKTLLFNVGVTLLLTLTFHLCWKFIKIFNIKKYNLKRVKIS